MKWFVRGYVRVASSVVEQLWRLFQIISQDSLVDNDLRRDVLNLPCSRKGGDRVTGTREALTILVTAHILPGYSILLIHLVL